MKNKWMSKEVQRLLPEDCNCLQCGVAKVFAVYKKSPPEQDWRDLGIVGIAAVILNTHTGATFLRLYEFDNVCGFSDVLHSPFPLFFLSVNSRLNATTRCSLPCFIVLNRIISSLGSCSRVKSTQTGFSNTCLTLSRTFSKPHRATATLKLSTVKIPQRFFNKHTHLIHRIQCGLVADLGSFLFLLVENPLLLESPNRSTCHELLGSFLRRLSPLLALLLPLLPSQRISRKAFLLPSSLPQFLRFPPKV